MSRFVLVHADTLEILVPAARIAQVESRANGSKIFFIDEPPDTAFVVKETPSAILALINSEERAERIDCDNCGKAFVYGDICERCSSLIGDSGPAPVGINRDVVRALVDALIEEDPAINVRGTIIDDASLSGSVRLSKYNKLRNAFAAVAAELDRPWKVQNKKSAQDPCCAHCGKPFTAGMSCGECGPRVDYKALNSLMDQLNSWKVAAVALADAVAESGDDVNDINVHKAFDNVRRLETGKTPQSAVKQAAPDVALLEAAEWILDRFNTNGLLYQSEIDTFTEHFNTIKAVRAAVEGKS